jgi:hypothetical protein
VPVIATGDMLVATEDALCGVACGDLAHDIAGDVYHAMLAAGTHVIAPVEPSEEMILKGHHQIDWCRDKQDTSVPEHETQRWKFGNKTGGTTCGDDIRDAYRAMLAAGKYALPAGKHVIVDAQREFICRECHLRIEEGKPASTDF